MNETHPLGNAYGLWPLVMINTALFVGFLLSFAKPNTKVEWRSFGIFTSFIVALFVEMYGFPLTVYLLASWLGNRYPVTDPFSHANGHLLSVFFPNIGTGHGSFFHVLSNVLIFAGGITIANGWTAIHQAAGKPVTLAGPYKYVRHPQYTGFIMVILGFLIQWPTFVTLLMAPVLIVRYLLLAKKEEQIMLKQYPEEYKSYMQKVPAWIPRL